MTTLSEDDIYRTSTQYRLWSFTPEKLASLRETTHNNAVQRARQYLPSPTDTGSDATSQLLTLDEEVRLVQRYCDTTLLTCTMLNLAVNVKATAVQYLKRFYLTNSAHTYPPKEIYKTVLFLASKTEGVHMPAAEYAHRIKTPVDVVLAPEYKIIQALRFTLDVRQPYRALKGWLMEMNNYALGNAALLPFLAAQKSPADIQHALAALPAPSPSCLTTWQPTEPLPKRAGDAYAAARTLLGEAALLTDVAFLYTPPQIYLAAVKLADGPLYDFYMATKLGIEAPQRAQILGTIAACADVLAGFDKRAIMSKEERAAIEKRLETVRDPGTRDLVKRNEEVKRGGGVEGRLEEGVVEKRRAAREASMREGEDLFGPALVAG